MSINLFKKSALGLIVLGLAGASHAGTINGFFIGGEGLDLQARNGDLDYITVSPTTVDSAYETHAVNQSYQWGWKLFAGMKFCGNEDITIGWQHWKNDSDDSTRSPAGDSTPRYLTTGAWSDVTGATDIKLDEVYGVFAHTFHMDAWTMRLAAGVEWAKVHDDLSVTANTTIDSVVTGFGYETENHLNGVGPRAEMALAYHLPYNFAVFGTSNVALLVSSRDVSLNTLNVDSGLYPSVYYSNRHVVVPKYGMRLGVGYSYTFGGTGGEGAAPMTTTVSVAAGWQVESYVHAVERPYANTLLATAETKTSNFGDEGLFLGAQVSCDWL